MGSRGQVWVETVLYTLIGLALMGLVLAFVMPRINESKDRLLVEQTITSLFKFDEKVIIASEVPGNVRIVEFMMKRGELYINGSSDEIVFVLKGLNGAFSEPEVEIDYGSRMKLLTLKEGKKYDVSLKVSYANNLTFKKLDELKKFDAVSTPYSFSIENLGSIGGSGKFVISIDEISGKV